MSGSTTGPADLPPAGLPPEEAIAFFRSKGFAIGFNWQDIFKIEHVRWFTVAKAMTRDLLEDIRAEVDRAISDGTTLADFKKALRPKLEAKGWWGRKSMIDPATGEQKIVQLGSPRRLKTIFDTNLRTAYQAGKWERIQRTKLAFPFLEYASVMDGRERPEHHAWDGTILPVDDPWWQTHYGPCDWNCRCTAIPRSQRMLDRMGLKVSTAPVTFPQVPWTNTRTGETGTLERGIGKGWDYNVGEEYLRGLAPSPLPESFDGPDDGPDDVGATLSAPQRLLIDRFLSAFDVAPGKETIWMDRDGWPLSIGRGWFIGAGGAIRLPRRGGARAIDAIAGALTKPDAILWVWVKGEDGRALLMRRYRATRAGMMCEVDVGGVGWRWRIVRAGSVAASYDPRQPRHGKGSPHGGQFKSTGRAAALASLMGDRRVFKKIVIGQISTDAAHRARGVADIAGKGIVVDHSYGVKILNKHGPGNERQDNHAPVSARMIFSGHKILNRAQTFSHGEPNAVTGQPRIVATLIRPKRHIVLIAEVHKRTVTIVTIYQRKRK